MSYFFEQIKLVRWLLITLLLVLGCGGGGGGGGGSAVLTASTVETFADVMELSIIESFDTSGTSYGVLKDGNIVYVADGKEGLLILNASNPSGFEMIGSLQLITDGNAFFLAKKGDYLFLAAENDGFMVVDVSTPSNPLLVFSYDTPDLALYITIEGDTMYVGDWYYFLIFDISNPTNPILIKEIAETILFTRSVFAQPVILNQMAYVAGSFGGINLVFISDPDYAELYSTINTGYNTWVIAKYGNYLLAGGQNSGLHIYHVEDILPSFVTSLAFPGQNDQSIYQIIIQDHYAYIANGKYGIQVVDIKDPSSPYIAAHLDTPGDCRGLFVDGEVLFAADSESGIHMINIELSPDSDGDRIPDSWEIFYFDNLTTADASSDYDSDGSPDASEYSSGTDPVDPDTDGDTYLDGDDAFPFDIEEWADNDGDGIGNNGDAFPDNKYEWEDTDGDGIGDNADTDDDGDGLSDIDEVDLFETEPLIADTDSNGISDGEEDFDSDGLGNADEIKAGADPFNEDSDSDGILDGSDNCPTTVNPDQLDTDIDTEGNECDLDDDYDGITDDTDDFPLDTNNNGVDNDVDPDDDGDGAIDEQDSFPLDDRTAGASLPANRYANIVIEINGEIFGTIKLELFEDQVPLTTRNFIRLATDPVEPYYDGLIFHRVIAGFMIQGGDPNGNGTGGPGYKIIDEFPKDDSDNLILTHDSPGILSMANSGPNTGGSQFFITLDETSWLDGKHTVFGQVVEGMEWVQAIGLMETDSSDKPLQDVIIKSVTITDN